MASAARPASWANRWEPPSRSGSWRLTSTATTASEASASSAAASAYWSTVRPQMLATPQGLEGGEVLGQPGGDTGALEPDAVHHPGGGFSRTRGGGLPTQGPAARDFTTTAPNSDRSW